MLIQGVEALEAEDLLEQMQNMSFKVKIIGLKKHHELDSVAKCFSSAMDLVKDCLVIKWTHSS